MTDINFITLSGVVGKDAVVKNTTGADGQMVNMFGFSIAVKKSKKDANGNWIDEPSWVDCVYTTRMQNITILKGEKVLITGTLNEKRWNDQNGMEQRRLRVLVDRLEKIQLTQPRQNQAQTRQQNTNVNNNNINNNYSRENAAIDDGIPF
jgi:single stranded DNA-binding protein